MRHTLSLNITRLRGSARYSMELAEFYPVEGFEVFLEAFCGFIDERLIDWHESEESGIGRITFKRRELPIYWSASAMNFCFHCQSSTEASEMRALVIDYFDAYPEALN
ncbi:MAG: hypothetical protein NBV65_12755 [Burkholderiaceae bacterium]|jgi:hypothetical protein|nr:hypothetical protein [Burkholderiaceae bacterium]